jgi:hypothetical protein
MTEPKKKDELLWEVARRVRNRFYTAWQKALIAKSKTDCVEKLAFDEYTLAHQVYEDYVRRRK